MLLLLGRDQTDSTKRRRFKSGWVGGLYTRLSGLRPGAPCYAVRYPKLLHQAPSAQRDKWPTFGRLTPPGRPLEFGLWSKERDAGMRDFGWQNGYGAFSIGGSQIKVVRRYIAEQEQHHRELSFQDKFRLLLERYELA
jgi:hypothetical protein